MSAAGLRAPGAHWWLSCLRRLPQPAPPANTFPAAAAATSQPVRTAENRLPQSGLPTHWRCSPPLQLGPRRWWHRHRFPCCAPQRPCLEEGAGPGPKPRHWCQSSCWELGAHRTGASGSGWAPTGGFFFPCKAQIYGGRSQQQSELSHSGVTSRKKKKTQKIGSISWQGVTETLGAPVIPSTAGDPPALLLLRSKGLGMQGRGRLLCGKAKLNPGHQPPFLLCQSWSPEPAPALLCDRWF